MKSRAEVQREIESFAEKLRAAGCHVVLDPPPDWCPGCGKNWRLFTPARIQGTQIHRCVKCERTYDEGTWGEVRTPADNGDPT